MFADLTLSLFFAVAVADISELADPACLQSCANDFSRCVNQCGKSRQTYWDYCQPYCKELSKFCQAKSSPGTEVARGSCGSVHLSEQKTIICPIPGASGKLKLQLELTRQLSQTECVKGVNYGLTESNTHMWVSSGCAADFIVWSMDSPQSQDDLDEDIQIPNSFNQGFCGIPSLPHFRIIGGKSAVNCQFPWVVMVFNRAFSKVCGGTIIDSTHILSAAHCFWSKNLRSDILVKSSPEELIVISGTSIYLTNRQRRRSSKNIKKKVIQITTHENYIDEYLVNDIAILTLESPITFDSCHRPICLADGSKSPQETQNCVAMGWGVAKQNRYQKLSSQLQFVELPVATEDQCRRVFTHKGSGTFCAGAAGYDACLGDSGGPFACKEADGRYYQFGIVSAGTENTCGENLGLYTNVGAYYDWIIKNRED